jgi:hypothetical protein
MPVRNLLNILKQAVEPVRPRLMPSVIIVGAQKAGTSALFKMLALHPKIIPPAEKEITFFGNDEHYGRGLEHYRDQLPLRPARGTGWITLDATPNYLYRPEAAKRIRKHLPHALIIAILRDPVKRAYSDWNMFHQFKDSKRHGMLYDPRSFEEAMTAELAAPTPFGYLARGCYADQLARYFELFGRDRVMVFAYPEFKRDPRSVAGSIVVKAGLDPEQLPLGLTEVKAHVVGYKQEADVATLEHLRDFYFPHNSRLKDLLGYPIDLAED